ncbi:MAG: sigma-E factor negative regulatory protein [Proteobacteria bacterium]|nr:sigma-E factor negative regulatory protein [Pseudomonadota bacterium]
MSDLLNEQLSALLDGELPPEETTLLLHRLGREPALAARLARYRLCGDVLRGERIQPRPDFAMRVSARVAAEAPLPAPAAVRRPRVASRWLARAAGAAIAAGVAVVAVVVLRQSPELTRAPMLAQSAPAPAIPAAIVPTAHRAGAAERSLAATGSEPEMYVTPAARPGLAVIPEGTLANYVVAHSQSTSPLAGQSVLIHLVADDARGQPRVP